MRETLTLRHRRVSSRIKSIQRGTIVIGGASTSQTATIVAADPENALLIYLGHTTTDLGLAADPYRSNWARLAFTDSVTITAVRNVAAPNTPGVVTVSYAVVEYYPGVIQSIQRGTISSGTAAVSAVDLTRAELFMLGFENTGADSATAIFANLARLSLTDATTITHGSGGVIGYQLVEWI